MNAMTIALFAYVGLQLVIGILVSRRIETEEDYLLAGRSLGPMMATASVFATWFGAEACVGAAGQAYREGLGPMSVEPFAYGIALVIVGLLLAAPLWRQGVTTFPDFLRKRFSPGVERVAAVLHIPGTVLWASAQVRAFGQIVASTAGIDLTVAITIAAVIAIIYTTAGGLLADVVTDLVQGGVLLLGLLAVTIAVVVDAGGISGAFEAATNAPRAVHETPGALTVMEAWLIPIGGSLVSQEVLARAMAARSPNVARGAVVSGGVVYIFAGAMPLLVGLIGAGLIPGLEDGEQIMPTLARDRLHPILFVVFAGALVSAILSTIDSSLLVAGSLLSRNVIHSVRTDTSDAVRLRSARLAVLGFGVVAWLVALRSDSVFSLVEQASGFGSAGMLVVLLMGLFTKSGGPVCSIATLATGVVSWIVLRYVIADYPYPWLTCLALAFAVWWLAHILTRQSKRKPIT